MNNRPARGPFPLIGAHQSIAGGFHKAVERAAADGCNSLQLFTKSPRAWKEPPPLDERRIALFRQARARHRIVPVVAHGSYLVNPCAADPGARRKGRRALVADARHCDELGIELLVLHPGSPGPGQTEAGIDRVADCLASVRDHSARVVLLLENTAGQGHGIGHRFEHLARIIERTGADERIGVCFDTCHGFAAGYDLRTARAARRTFDELDAAVGAGRLRALHLNDCRSALGSRSDRHALIGQGQIGRELFGWILGQRRFADLPAILETPIASGETYRAEVSLLRSLASRKRFTRAR